MVDLNITLPENFLEDEERSGYLVKKEMKELWAVQMDLLMELDRVCSKHNIKYFVMYGTLLGAVRHKGFIPWDDDIDVTMTREEFNKLVKYKDEFKNPYFFQTEYTDPGSHTFYGKLRNSNTTAILKPEIQSKYQYNQGIFIDIFVMDNVPEDELEYKAFRSELKKGFKKSVMFARFFDSKRLFFQRKILYVFSPFIFLAKIFIKLFKIKNIPLKNFDQLANRYNKEKTKKITFIGFGTEKGYPREWFDEVVYLDFENLKVPCPKEYEKVLTFRYGDWKEFVIGTQAHTMEIIDVKKSYKEYL